MIIQKLICCQIPQRYLFSVNFPHPVGIVISSHVKIGKNVVIYQNVTIGGEDLSAHISVDYPEIGNNVIIYAGSVIAGRIKVGDNVIIGANSFVSEDIPANSIIVGFNQAKKRRKYV